MDINIIYQLVMALAGLGILLYGIRLMNTSMETVLGYRFKRTLSTLSGNPFRTYGLGAGTTFLLQTSVLTITMTVGLINIGAIGLIQSLVLIIGANFGAACSIILLAFESFSLLKFFALFCIIGVAILIFARNQKAEIVGNTLLGFGLLCLGITMLSSSMEELTTLLDIASVMSVISNPILLILIGTLLSVLMQGSYPVTAILIAFVASGVMGFDSACFALWGANLGTGIILLFLTGFGNGYNGRRVVVFNVLMKIFGCILFSALMFVPLWTNWINMDLCGGIPSISLVVMTLLFNLVPGLLLLPFIKPISRFMEWMIRQRNDKEKGSYDTFELDDRVINNPAIAYRSVKDNIAKILNMEIELNKQLCSAIFEKKVDHTAQKGKLRALEKAIKLTVNNTIRVGGKYAGDDLEKINALLNILNDTTQILKVCTRFDGFAQIIQDKPRSLLNSQIDILKQLGKEINDLGDKVCEILNTQKTVKEREDKLNEIFQLNDLNIANNTAAKHNLLACSVKDDKKRDNSLYFNLLYEFGKLGTDYTDIAIKITLTEE